MKFTTDLERYFFACACIQHAESMIQFSDKMRHDKTLSKKSREDWDNNYFKYVKRSNFWFKVRDHFEHVLNDFSNFTKIKMSTLVG